MRGLLSVLAAVTAVLSFGVAAAVITETTANSPFTPGSYNQGWWSDTAPNREGTTNDNYFTGHVRSPGGLGETRSFFTFDLSDIPVSDIIVGADLRPIQFEYVGSDPSETIEFFDVSTSPVILNDNFAFGLDETIFDDLGTGSSYGSFVVASYEASTSSRLIFPLNLAALADLNAARGGFFSIGGRLQTISGPTTNEGLFGFSGGHEPTLLVLTTQPAQVPEPATLALIVLGIIGIGVARRRT